MTEAGNTIEYHDLRGHGIAREQIRDHRRIEVGRMLLARTPIRTMASRLGVSARTVQKDIKVIERWWQAEAKVTVADQVARQLKILDELERAWLGRAMYDDGAVDVLLRIMTRRAKLIGLDAPTQAQVEVGGIGSVEEVRARALEVVQDDLQRRRELNARAIDVASQEHTG